MKSNHDRRRSKFKRKALIKNPSSEVATQNDDDLNEILTRHHRKMLLEQKDRKIYERHIREQRALRRMQCRRTHVAHLNNETQRRLLKQLERERRHRFQEEICSELSESSIVFQTRIDLRTNYLINWTTLEENRTNFKLHDLDMTIKQLKKLCGTSTGSRPRPSVRERQKQKCNENSSPLSNVDFKSLINLSASFSPRVTLVRCVDPSVLSSKEIKRLTSIENCLPNHKFDASSTDAENAEEKIMTTFSPKTSRPNRKRLINQH